MAPNSALLLFLVQTVVLATARSLSSCPSRALCVAQPPSTGQALLETLRSSLCGCTTIDGSISIDLSSATTPDSSSTQLTASNFSFLADVQEITGYLELKGVRVHDLLSLPSLRVIHGRELKDGRALVVDSVVAPEGVVFPKLSEIVTGNAYFSNVTGVCGYMSVNWSDVLSNGSLQEGSTATCEQVSGNCSACHSGHCWRPGSSSEGEMACQTLSHTVCPSSCGGNRCFFAADNVTLECCDQRCVGGCTGVTAADCFACRTFSDGGVCASSCPPAYVYNSEDHSLAVNTEHKLTAGFFCVNSCPVGLYAKDGVCVTDCGEGFNMAEGNCVPLTKQPVVCPGMSVSAREALTQDNVDSYAGCTVIDGHFWISAATSQDILRRRITEAQLDGLLSIEEIQGSLIVTSYNRPNLTFLQNVKVIGSHNITLVNGRTDLGDSRSTESVAIFMRANQQLTCIDLSSLQQIVSGDVFLSSNDMLCYLPNFSLLLDGSPGQIFDPDTLSAYRRPATECANEGLVCHAQCNSTWGCGGPSASQCVRCMGYRDTTSQQCVSTCDGIPGVYSNASSLTCEPCHGACSACSGPSQSDCTSCANLEVTPSVSPLFGRRLCVMVCPVGLYANGTSCESCSGQCSGMEGCTGPAAVVGSGGCFSCGTVVIQGTMTQCVSSCPPQRYRAVLTSASGSLVAGTAVCRPCSEGCLTCSGPAPSQCSQCTTVGVMHANRTLECVDACPDGTYSDTADRLCQSCDTKCECCTEPLTDYCNACMNLRSNSCISGCSTNGSNGGVVSGSNDYLVLVVSVVPAAVVLLTLLLLVALVVCCILYKRAGNKGTTLHSQDFEQGSVALPFYTKSKRLDDPLALVIPVSEIEKRHQLADGPHASVYKGIWSQGNDSRTEVAIKEVKDTVDVSLEDSSVAELQHLKHSHVVQVHGLSVNSSIYIISEFLPKGPLDRYLQDNAASVRGGDLLSYAVQVAKGMSYLESQQVIHGGLALRNILVHSHSKVKISDVGWARLIQQSCKDLVPIRWLPPECIGQAVPSFSTSKSEVWAFGVLLWEMLTYGEYPYADCDTAEGVFHQVVTLRAKLRQPEACSEELYALMEMCWDRNSAVRLSFEGLVSKLADMTASPDSFIDSAKLPRKPCTQCQRPLFERYSNEMNRASMSPDSGRGSGLGLERPPAAVMPSERLV